MKATARLKYLRISPRKVRMVADLVRGKNVEQAQAILRFAIKKGSLPILKLLNSAIASAKHNFKLAEHNLYIAKITVDEGPKLKRIRPRARGQAYPIHKKTSHITIVLDEKEPTGVQAQKTGAEGSVREQPHKRADRVLKSKKQKFRGENEVQAPKQVREKERIFRRIAI